MSRWPRVAFHKKRNGIPRGPSTRVYRVALFFGFQHVLDQLAGHFFGADVIGSVGHSLLQLFDFFPPRLIDWRFAVAGLLCTGRSLGWLPGIFARPLAHPRVVEGVHDRVSA